jgi:shikimate kinase
LAPNPAQSIALTGFMAVGKSAVGRVLARRLKRRFVDLDKVVEKAEGMTVKDLFAIKGEPYFRAREKEALTEALKSADQVIATGGGAILDEENLRLLQESALLVCLTAAPEALLKRVGAGSKRPLLKDGDRKSRIEEILALRADKYARAHLTIDTTDLTVNQVAEKIIEMAKLEMHGK